MHGRTAGDMCLQKHIVTLSLQNRKSRLMLVDWVINRRKKQGDKLTPAQLEKSLPIYCTTCKFIMVSTAIITCHIRYIFILAYHLQLGLRRVLSPTGFPTNMHAFPTRLLAPHVYIKPVSSPSNQQPQ
jgi:hypothetical protein